MHNPITTGAPRPEDFRQIQAWTSHLWTSPAQLPISFTFDGNPIQGIPSEWQPSLREHPIDAQRVERVYEGRETTSGLSIRVESVIYADYPVVEWTAWLTHTGTKPTPLISDLLGLNGRFEGRDPILWHANGDFGSGDGYAFQETPLRSGDALRFAPEGGRSCDQAFPYYRLIFKDGGLALTIGWPAQWSAAFQSVPGGVQIKAGQEITHLRLMPGETIRTPRMTLLAWSGDASRAANLWRRWYRKYILPRPDGKQPLKPLLACAATDEGEEFTAATETNQIRYLTRFIQRGIHPDVWWIDAGWYPCDPTVPAAVPMPPWSSKWWNTGTWEPDPKRFPRGLKPISDCAAREGTDLLVWFEPERVWPGSRLYREHPEWLLKIERDDTAAWSARDNALLNLGLPTCRRWLTDEVCRLIQDNGIKIYRQDHNFPPLEYWRVNEPRDRQGMNENLHVQGYLQYWDDLLARNPGLWIDSCASGGRRNDLETMRRSVPLHYTDFGYGDLPVKLAFHHVLYEWLPYFKEFTLAWDLQGPSRFDHQVDSYSFQGGMAPMLFATLDIRRDDYDFALAAQMIAIWRRAADLLLHGDYYPLTPIHRTPTRWVARQFDCPETGRGLLQGFRLPAAPEESLTVYPKNIRPDTRYVFENPETGETRDIPSNDLIRTGFTLRLPARSAALWFYQPADYVLKA